MWTPNIYGTVFGSDTVVIEQTTVQSLNNTDIINGFTAFVGGISIATGASTHYNNYFPLYGPISFNNTGILNLSRNLTLGGNATFSTGGSINGNSFGLNMPTKTAPFVISNGTVFGNLTLTLNGPLTLNSVLTFTNTCAIEGNGNIIDCTNGALAIGTGGNLLIQNATLKGLSSNHFYCYDNTGTVTLDGVTCLLSNDLTFSNGRLEFFGNNLFTGSSAFVFESTVPITIHSNTTWMLDQYMNFIYNPGNANLLLFSDVTSVLRLFNASFAVFIPGIQLTKGTMIIDGLCQFEDFSLNQAYGINFGDGISAANNFNITVLAESGIFFINGYLINNNV
jgi:hypothetical protein